MLKSSSIWVEEPNEFNEYGLRVDVPDEDGIKILETLELVEVSAVYLYFSEIPKLIGVLQKVYNDNRNK